MRAETSSFIQNQQSQPQKSKPTWLTIVSWGWGGAQLVKRLHKDLSSISKTHKKQPGVGTYL